jgi:putative ATPase
MDQLHQNKSILFIDEIHRFNKAQQDALLPHLEQGDFMLIGATTEHPQTALNKALLSRVQYYHMQSLNEQQLAKILENACSKLNYRPQAEILTKICQHANGDARVALNKLASMIELPANYSAEQIYSALFENTKQYDKDSDRHYDVISAFIKSIRGSDPDAALIWLAVMLDGGEDIEFIARRLIILASEDIGLAYPDALNIATSAHYAIKQIGMPEARIPLAQATVALACAPKSNACYQAIDKALQLVRTSPTLQVPTHLRNHHPDKANYRYPHDYKEAHVEQNYRPSNLDTKQSKVLSLKEIGLEKNFKSYLERFSPNGKSNN